MTLAPLVVKDKVIIGVAGGEYGIRGFIAAHDAATGEEAWRFYTIPAPGEPGSETWADGGDAWQHGGASVWLTGSYDAALDLTYWGIGNPGPDWNPAQRPGDNLYSDSVVALDPDTGELKWHFQFTPNDDYDYDAVQIPVLVDLPTASASSGKLMLWANRNGYFYVLDRATGEFIRGNPFVNVNWASGLDESGRPIETPQPLGSVTFPGVQGGTNWYSPSFSPRTGLLYLSAWENYGSVFRPAESEYQAGRTFVGGIPGSPPAGANNLPGIRRGPINNWTEALGTGAVIALDPRTGKRLRSDHRRFEQRCSDDGHGSRLHGEPRRLRVCARRPQRRAALARQPRRPRRERPHLIRRRRQAICRAGLRKRSVRVRIARLASRFAARPPRHIQYRALSGRNSVQRPNCAGEPHARVLEPDRPIFPRALHRLVGPVVLAVWLGFRWTQTGDGAYPMLAALVLALLGLGDLLQRQRSVLRNYPVIGHLRFLLELIRPEIRQYFLEADNEETPFSRQQRSIVYQRAKGDPDKRPFGTQLDQSRASGYEWINHSLMPTEIPALTFA